MPEESIRRRFEEVVLAEKPGALKFEPRAELKNARREGSGDPSEGRAVDIENIAVFARRAVSDTRRSEEIGAVEDVERFGAKLQTEAFGEPETLAQTEIDGQEIRPVDKGAFEI